ncbi:MAG: alanine racemase [Aquihabitans sp.]
MRPVRAEIDLDAVMANARVLKATAAGALLCAVVKADGYGHGAVPVARAALSGGADVLGVALVAEGAELRDAQISAPILVLSQASSHELDDLVAQDLEATVYTLAGIDGLADASRRAERHLQGRPVNVHLKIDTGMHRVGAQPSDAVTLAQAIRSEPSLRLVSVFTHFAVADEPDEKFTDVQLDRYHAVLDQLGALGIDVPLRHAANTAGNIAHPASRLDLVRCGIGIYGLAPSPALDGRVALRPAMSLVARVSHLQRVSAGEGVSYGLRYRTDRDTTIATIPLGYADGIRRGLSAAGGEVLIGGRRLPMAGTITMDQFLVDCGDHAVAVGDQVVLIGHQGEEQITADEWARLLGTISYEVVCGISPRVPRHYQEANR